VRGDRLHQLIVWADLGAVLAHVERRHAELTEGDFLDAARVEGLRLFGRGFFGALSHA
jgi:hypothetical protein